MSKVIMRKNQWLNKLKKAEDTNNRCMDEKVPGKRLSDDSTCIACGSIIPEGRLVCKICEIKSGCLD